jgi:Na+/melibiose symporter-like transporter
MQTSLSLYARYLVLITSGILAFFSIGSLTRLGLNPDAAGWIAVYAFVMLIEAVVLLFCYFRLKQRNKSIFWLACVILALNIVLPIFDQVGLADILFILLNAAALALLYISRKDFLPA